MSERRPRPAVIAGTALASALLLLTGVLSITQGIAAIAKDDVYATVGKYAYKFDISTWGWIHLAIGVVMLVVGLALYTGSILARGFAIVVASIAIAASFLDLPYQPYWSLILIGINLFIIWALFHNVGPDNAME
jgi:hypothetical protein